MKALTVWQPWATLIAIGAKRIETRGWPTKYRGTIAIHAAKKMDREVHYFCLQEQIRKALMARGFKRTVDLPFGVVVCVAELVDCWEIREDNIPDEPERSFGDYTPGRYAWVFDNVLRLARPIPARGAQGLWEWEGELVMRRAVSRRE